jgi:hypothetical protein
VEVNFFQDGVVYLGLSSTQGFKDGNRCTLCMITDGGALDDSPNFLQPAAMDRCVRSLYNRP